MKVANVGGPMTRLLELVVRIVVLVTEPPTSIAKMTSSIWLWCAISGHQTTGINCQ